MLFGLAFRNLFRNLRRTLITSVAVVFGVALSIVGWGLVDGLDENALRAAGTTFAGDVLLRPEGYPTDGTEYPLGESLVPSPALVAALDAQGPWASRVFFQARIVHGPESTRGVGIGFDPAKDPAVFPRDRWNMTGAWPAEGALEVVVGSGLARLMALEPGEAVVIEARTHAGALNALTYVVSGVVSTDNGGLDGLGFWMPIAAATDLLQLEGQRTHLAVRTRSPEAASAALAGHGWLPRTTREECADVLALNGIRRRALLLLVGVIMAIAGTGIANTVIMSVYERVREVGTLMALGMRKAQIRTLFLLEGAVMGLTAGVLGSLLGAAFVLYYQDRGIELMASVTENAGTLPVSAMLYTRFGWPPLFVSLAFGVAIAVGASLWPARYASTLNPADAVRAD